ncbi:hypothetical protein LINPERPRIM_LOCUS21120 [Linum perenne]
MHCRLGSW